MFYPVDIQVSWWKTALREDLEPHFIQCDIKGDEGILMKKKI